VFLNLKHGLLPDILARNKNISENKFSFIEPIYTESDSYKTEYDEFSNLIIPAFPIVNINTTKNENYTS